MALQMCVRDSILYLSTRLSYRTTERLANLTHHALPFLCCLNSPHVSKNHIFRFVLFLGYVAKISDVRGDHVCPQRCFESYCSNRISHPGEITSRRHFDNVVEHI